ncbi:hypothetical protein [Methylocaldum szegediense]|jgi:hypothetical protein|uniref:hypothetical protein n=1 Tax=Methylocaldum szegediense TaxID=73780 RepID=UPI0012EBCEE4|nr:hypothetical protein [Methylocaldum szegediense]
MDDSLALTFSPHRGEMRIENLNLSADHIPAYRIGENSRLQGEGSKDQEWAIKCDFPPDEQRSKVN